MLKPLGSLIQLCCKESIHKLVLRLSAWYLEREHSISKELPYFNSWCSKMQLSRELALWTKSMQPTCYSSTNCSSTCSISSTNNSLRICSSQTPRMVAKIRWILTQVTAKTTKTASIDKATLTMPLLKTWKMQAIYQTVIVTTIPKISTKTAAMISTPIGIARLLTSPRPSQSTNRAV